MTLSALTLAFPWSRYSKKLIQKIAHTPHAGMLTVEDGIHRGLRLFHGTEGSIADGNVVRLYWLVDPANGVIQQASFEAYGQSALIGAAEAVCELLQNKNYDQARRIAADLIDKELRDKSDRPAFPPETFAHLNLVIGAIEEAADKCCEIPLPEKYVAPPAPMVGDVLEGGYPGFSEMSLKQQLAVIEDVLDRDVRPYIALDGGGVEVIDLVNNRDVVVSYKGNCTSCFSSTGATLSYIQQTLRAKVHPDLNVTPNL